MKEGDKVKAGTILALQEEEQVRLKKQKERLEEELTKLQPYRTRPVPPLPPVSYLAQEAAVQKAQARVAELEEMFSRQRERVDRVADLPEAVLQHENAKRVELEKQLEMAKIDLAVAEGSLEQARQRRAEAEYDHAIREQFYEQNERRAQQILDSQRARLIYQLNLVEYSLSRTTEIRSPWPGTVQRIRWLEQRGNDLVGELTLAISGEVRTGDPVSGDDASLPRNPNDVSLPEEPEAEELEPPALFSF